MSRRQFPSLPHSLAIASPSARDHHHHSSSFALDDDSSSHFPLQRDADPQMMFGLDLDDSLYEQQNNSTMPWSSSDYSLASPLAESVSNFASPTSPHKDSSFFESSVLFGDGMAAAPNPANDYFTPWINEAAFEPVSSQPIPIPDAKSPTSPTFIGYHPSEYHSPFYQDASSFSPPFAPSSFSPDSDYIALASPTSPPGFAGELPAAQQQQQPQYGTPVDAMAQMSLSAAHDATLAWPALPPRQFGAPRPAAHRRLSASAAPGAGAGPLLFQPSSAPSALSVHRPLATRAYSGVAAAAPAQHQGYRANSAGADESGVAPSRRRRRGPSEETDDVFPSSPATADKALAKDDAPQKSVLRPPKLAPSAWQLYFTDWIQRHQASSTKKLNVAQAAKEAGQEYAALSTAEKEPYKRRSQQAKDARERELNAYMRTLTPDDIRRENAFRTAQRKAGKSRRGNIKDPNAPKKPLSAYFMFLQRIRADPELVADVFGDETETTKQSVLAASKWRSLTDEERKPFLAQAEQEKLEYEAARKLYEEGTTGHSGSYNFSILAANPLDLATIPRSAPAASTSGIKHEVPDADGFVISTAASLRA